jgi:hypothetical protein
MVSGAPKLRRKGPAHLSHPSSQEPAVSWQLELRELATFLGRADPWYQNTVNTLCPAIHKLAEMVGAASVRGGGGKEEHGI